MLLFFGRPLYSQSPQAADSSDFAFIPALGYNSDMGLVVGGVFNYFQYRADVSPFSSYVALSGMVSSKGLASISVTHDKPRFLGADLRLLSEVYVSRLLEDSYFGLANYGDIAGSMQTKNKLYAFKSLATGFDLTLRKPLLRFTANRQLDATAIVRFNYNTPWNNKDSRLISIEKPLGYKGGRTTGLGLGLIWEGRNSEFRPTSGQYFEVSGKTAQTWWGSSFTNLTFNLETRNYIHFHLLKEITFANRVLLKHTAGAVPYWELAYAGDKETLRGYPLRRFLDDNAVIINTELRTWLLKLEALDSEFGGTLFFDAGRSFPNHETLSNIINDLKFTFGFGGVASFFTPNFILRTDVGFSKEGFGIYLTTGFLF